MSRVTNAAIIAGGASRRMGTPKALLEFEGQTLVQRCVTTLRPLFKRIIVVTASQEIASAGGVEAIPDRYSDKGPLAGIDAALAHMGKPVFCVACDMPHLNCHFIEYMLGELSDYDAVVPRIDGFPEPLHAVYAPTCLPAIAVELAKPRPGPFAGLFQNLRVRYIEEEEAARFDPSLKMFSNWNTPDDIEQKRETTL